MEAEALDFAPPRDLVAPSVMFVPLREPDVRVVLPRFIVDIACGIDKFFKFNCTMTNSDLRSRVKEKRQEKKMRVNLGMLGQRKNRAIPSAEGRSHDKNCKASELGSIIEGFQSTCSYRPTWTEVRKTENCKTCG